MSLNDVLYDAFMYPLEVAIIRRKRRELVRRARGKILEIGAGTGANLRFYQWAHVHALHLVDLDPGDALKALSSMAGVPVATHEADALSLPFPDRSIDTVVATLVFCSVADQERALLEVRRVLRGGGTMIFIEHVRPEGPHLQRAVEAANPAWCLLNGQCNLNRDTLTAIRGAGFAVTDLHRDVGGLLIAGIASVG